MDRWDKSWIHGSLKHAMEQHERIKNLVIPPYIQELKQSSKFQILQAKGFLESPLYKSIEQAKQLASSLALSQTDTVRALKSVSSIPNSWGCYYELMRNKMLGVENIKKYAMGHSAAIESISILSEKLAVRMDYDQLGMKLGISTMLSKELMISYDNLVSSYCDYFDEISNMTDGLLSTNPLITLQSSRELFNETNALSIITPAVNVDEDDDKELHETINRVNLDFSDSIDDLLLTLSKDFALRYRGAKEALLSSNPDKVRHVCTSLRELFIEYLNLIAPDREVRDWVTNPDLFTADNQVTRKAKLLYLCKDLDSGYFKEFIEKDIDSILMLYHMLNSGTHGAIRKYTTTELRTFLIRIEGAIQILYELKKIN